jgi:hypothetical protein
MTSRSSIACLCLLSAFLATSAAKAADSTEKIRNEKVVVTLESLAPGESSAPAGENASMVVFLGDGEASFRSGGPRRPGNSVRPGETVALDGADQKVTNSGAGPTMFVRIEFLTQGLSQTWGMAGLGPNYKMLVENRYARAYDIKIPAQTFEPQHTHHDRVVICLSGAELEHILPDGSKQPSTLKSGEIVWRLGATHIGHNMGHTDLWVIAIEPK